jgi:hypothetical protein
MDLLLWPQYSPLRSTHTQLNLSITEFQDTSRLRHEPFVVITCTTCFNILITDYINALSVIRDTNGDHFPKQYKLILVMRPHFLF